MEVMWNNGKRFLDKTVIVTGASGALGGATALSFGREGANVVLSYRNARVKAEEFVSTIIERGGTAWSEYLDVADAQSVDRFIARANDRFGSIDVLVNAAGRIDAADAVRFENIKLDAWDQLFEIDVRGTMLMCAAVVPQMRRAGRGVIVNFSGSYGNGVDQENLVNSVAVQYCAAKGAVRAFTAALARDLAPNIRVNAVAPGAIEANWAGDWGIPTTDIDAAVAMTPLRRLGRPEEIAESVLFLASEGAGYITGQILQVDGGWLMTG